MTREKKFTPGPWRVGMESGHNANVITAVSDGDGICLVYGIPQNRKVDEVGTSSGIANAHLIAAAPDLMEALERLLNAYLNIADSGDAGNWDAEKESEVVTARAAIAKAYGETK